MTTLEEQMTVVEELFAQFKLKTIADPAYAARYLSLPEGSEVATKSITEAAKYADEITTEAVSRNYNEYFRHAAPSIEKVKEKVGQIRAAAVGNIAYVATHCSDEEIRAMYAQLYQIIQDYYLKEAAPCAQCRKRVPVMMQCSKCKMVQYCSVACQKSHWKNHKLVCN